MDPSVTVPLAITVIALGFSYASITGIVRARRHRRDQFHLDEAGIIVPAQVTAVEPLQRSVNHAAGHPVTITIRDPSGFERAVRDTTGLGGYVAREGQQVMVRLSPDDPDLFRVEQLVGQYGPYPTRRAGETAGGSHAPLWLFLLVPVVLGAGAAGYWWWGDGILLGLPALFALIGLGLLVGSIKLGRSRRKFTAETTGVVTEVWTERIRSSNRRGGSRTIYAHTVHFFTQDGREVHSRNRSANGYFRPNPQQPVRVRHDPAHPPAYEVAGQGSGVGQVAALAFIGVVFLLVGLVGTGIVALVARASAGLPG